MLTQRPEQVGDELSRDRRLQGLLAGLQAQ